MLEYFSYKKYKQYKDGRDAQQPQQPQQQRREGGNGSSSSNNNNRNDYNSNSNNNNNNNGNRSSNSRASGKGKARAEDPPSRSSTEAAGPAKPLLKPEDQEFFEEICSNESTESLADEDSPPPPLPPRIYDWEMDSCSETEGASGNEGPSRRQEEERAEAAAAAASASASASAARAKEQQRQTQSQSQSKPSRLSVLFTKPNSKRQESNNLAPPHPTTTTGSGANTDAERASKDASRVLDRLNFFVKNNTVLAYTKDSSELMERFTVVFKDLVNGVPSAYDDLTRLIEDRDGSIAKLFDKLPNSLQRMVTQLPEKLTGTLAPELLTAVTATQGLRIAEGASVKDTAKNFLKPNSLTDVVRKPGAVVAMFKAIVNVLKMRWPAFIGMNVIWSVSLSLLLVVLWYCYKRGRDERLGREAAAAAAQGQHIQDLQDERTVPAIVMSPGPSSGPSSSRSSGRTRSSKSSKRQ